MQKVIVTEFLSLDGVFEDPAPPPGYPSLEISQFKSAGLFESGALLLGRVTYEEFASYWPTMGGKGAFADRMNRLPTFVATTTLEALEWNATALGGDVIAAVAALRRQEGGNLLVYGSGTKARTLLRHGLADELRLMVYPLVRGNGKRFFSDEDRLKLQLVTSQPLGAGVMLLTYRPVTATPPEHPR